MSLSIDLAGWVVLVTGGARGVGQGIVETFLDAGAEVEMCGRSTPVQPVQAGGRSAGFTAVDVRDSDAAAAWVAEIADRRGRIDVLVNNAGGAPFATFLDSSPRFQRAITDLNFLSAAALSRAAYAPLRQTGGSIINVSSISARRPSPGTAIYGAAKAALDSLTTSLAVEWAPDVRVNAVSCGLVATADSLSHYGQGEQFDRVAATIPAGRLATPTDVGYACVLLASPLARYITGAVLNVDGGGEWPAFLSQTTNADQFRRPEGDAT